MITLTTLTRDEHSYHKGEILTKFWQRSPLYGAAPYSTIYDMVDSLTWNTDAGKQIDT